MAASTEADIQAPAAPSPGRHEMIPELEERGDELRRLCLQFDIQRAAALVREFTGGKTFADYEADAMLRSAVERHSRSSARR